MKEIIEKIKKRKNTTKKGLETLEEIVNSISKELNEDINTCMSSRFNVLYIQDNGFLNKDLHYREWENKEAYWKISNGNLKLISVSIDEYLNNELIIINHIKNIDFENCIESLKEVLNEYSKESSIKDKEVERFLNIYKDFANNN